MEKGNTSKTPETPTEETKGLVTEAQKSLVSECLINKYPGLEYIKFGKKSIDNWDDKRLRAEDYVELHAFRVAPQSVREQICNLALSGFKESVSIQVVGYMLVCAWNLKSCKDPHQYCFANTPEMYQKPKQCSELEKRFLAKSETPVTIKYDQTVHGDFNKFEKYVSYICASAIRMITKDSSSYMKSMPRIASQYKNFYKTAPSFEIKPDLKCVDAIRQLLQTRTVLKGTVGVFLLAFQELEGLDQRLCKELYESHLAYTGMHCYRLFLMNASKLETPHWVFFPLLRHPVSVDALETIKTLLTKYEYPANTEDQAVADKAKTWKYARIFDPDVFANVQTKNCELFTGLLATIAKKLGSAGAGDVTQIAQIRNVVANKADWLEVRAQRVIDYCMSAAWKDEEQVIGVYK